MKINQTQRQQIAAIIDDVDDMTIATLREDGFPQATTVSYFNDGQTIYFATSTEAQKAQNIANNNRVSVTINRPYDNWNEIEGLSMGAKARRLSAADELLKAGELLMKKFPQALEYADDNQGEVAYFCLEPVVVSILDYSKGFGHTELVKY